MSQYPWLGVFQQAREETDLSKLHALVNEAEFAIFTRMQELSSRDASDAATQTESQEINAAITELLRLKTDTLHWPSIEPTPARAAALTPAFEPSTRAVRQYKQ
jgi:hypothetical protein